MVTSSKSSAGASTVVRNIAEKVGDKKILARGLNARAQRTLIQIVQVGASHQFALAVETHAVKQPRSQLSAHRRNIVDTLRPRSLARSSSF